jgi:hypothetical protein
MKLLKSAIGLFIVIVIRAPFYSFDSNITGHMLSGGIAYQVKKPGETIPAHLEGFEPRQIRI